MQLEAMKMLSTEAICKGWELGKKKKKNKGRQVWDLPWVVIGSRHMGVLTLMTEARADCLGAFLVGLVFRPD